MMRDGRVLVATGIGAAALDLDTGEHLWMVPNGDGPRDYPALAHLDLPAGVSGAPMTYLHEGRQYIVTAISGTGFEGELLALALPEAPAAAAP